MRESSVGEEMANNAKNQKTINFQDIFYIVKKNWIVEIILFVLVVALGFVYTKINTDYHQAKADVVLRAEIGSSSSSYNDTVLSKMYLETMSQLIMGDAIVERASEIYGAEEIYAGNISVNYTEDSLLMTVFYNDNLPEKAVDKLNSIILACQEMTEGEEGILPAQIKLVTVGKTRHYPASDDARIRLFSVLGAIVVVAGYVLLAYFVRDRVVSVERLESITGKKNFVAIERKKTGQTQLPVGEGESEGNHIEIDLCKLSDTLIYMSDGENNKVFQIQSGISGEGKTTVSTNLAIALGESQRKTLIIDCDFSKPSIHRVFKLHRERGITDYFKGKKSFDEIVKPTGSPNVDLITCGEKISNHTIFFASPKFRAIIDEARKKYDFIILDCAPVRALSDYINISAIADATLLVVGNDKLSARELEYTVRELEACDANLIGTVFNFSASESKRKYYNYYYYHKKK